MNNNYFFTLTAGRTGTEWMASFLKLNLGIEAIHEPLAIQDFGVRMPDIKIMRTFNDLGNTEAVRSFYQNKFRDMTRSLYYAETNHALGKCGLVENLVLSGLADNTMVIVLNRDIVDQCVSYVLRRDFKNITIIWQWYLSYNYRNVIVPPQFFVRFNDSQSDNNISQALWYSYEMMARQIYYKTLYSDQIQFVDCKLETMRNPAEAGLFLKTLAGNQPELIRDNLMLPDVLNKNRNKPSETVQAAVESAIASIDLDVADLVRSYIESGRRLDSPT